MEKKWFSQGRGMPLPLRKILMVMKLTVVLMLIVLQQAFAVKSYAQAEKMSLNLQKNTLKEVFQMIEKNSDYSILYDESLVRDASLKSGNYESAMISSILDEILANEGLRYQVIEKMIVILKDGNLSDLSARQLQDERMTLKGRVNDPSGEPVVGVNVVIKGTLTGTITSVDGTYSLEVTANDVIVYSYIGFENQEINVAGRTVINITLVEEATGLDEVVVTALGIKRQEKALGYAVQKVDGEALQKVKGVDIGTSLTGKVAGLNIKNSTEFYDEATIELRGETPLIIIDGIPYSNISLRDVASDDIEEMSILKGATASALYGARGGSGAIMITTKKGAKQKGLTVSVNSNTMFNAGYLRLPEVQNSYSAGYYGKYNGDDYVWGDKMDIGRVYEQWDPISKSYKEMELTSKGKDNLKNFQEFSFITNNNVSIAQKGENGSFRTSLTHVYNKGQFPNAKMNKITYSVGGELKLGDKFQLESSMTYNKRWAPNISGKGYNTQGYIYNILVWTGSEYDLTDYKDYWITPGEEQNWHYSGWYDNPYLMAYEKLHGKEEDVINGYVSGNYQLTAWAKLLVRSGLDIYIDKETKRNPIGINSNRGWDEKGMYRIDKKNGYSLNNDLLLMMDYQLDDFKVDAVLGGTIYYTQDERLYAGTKNGINIPGFYSLNNSVEDPYVYGNTWKKQVNSLFGKATFAYKSALFIDVTGRNDWSSTLPEDSRSYFYPSLGASAIISEMADIAPWMSFWKVRGSWAVSKNDLGIYATNNTYSTATGVWDNFNSAAYPTSLRDYSIKPSTERTYEFGTVANFLQNRARFDLTYYNKRMYNRTVWAGTSSASGFESMLVNTKEELVRKGWEITVGGTPVKSGDWRWDANFNWSKSHVYYDKLDPVYSADKYWIGEGERYDAYVTRDYERTPDGQRIVKANGYPMKSDYESKIGTYEPDWIWGLTNVVKYKNLSLLMSFDGRVGGLSYSSTNARLWQSGAHIDSDNKYRYEEVVNGESIFAVDGMVVVSGDVVRDDYGRIVEDNREFAPNEKIISYESYNKYYGTGPQNILDETFIKLREISISYEVPSSFSSKLGMQDASVSFVGQNVFLWTKEYRFADPDIASDDLNSPSIRYLGVNLKMTF